MSSALLSLKSEPQLHNIKIEGREVRCLFPGIWENIHLVS